MSNNLNPLVEELKTLKDEINLQAHLFSMDAKDELTELEKDFSQFEHKMEDYMIKFGQLNEQFWVGNKEEIEKFKKEFESFKKKHIN